MKTLFPLDAFPQAPARLTPVAFSADCTVRIEHGSMLDVIPRLVADGVVVDAVVTDPPYHLSMNKQIIQPSLTRPEGGRATVYQRHGVGFMNQKWDGGDIAFRSDTWKTVAMIMRPGAFLIAFSGTRTHHRMWCAIEDGGFVIQDTILNMLATDTHVQRFLDSLDDEQRGAFGQAISASPLLAWAFGSGFPKRRDMLKPAFEPICLAYKPGGKRTMQIEECRIGTDGGMGRVVEQLDGLKSDKGWGFRKCVIDDTERGRFPADITHDGSDEVLAGFASFGERGSGFGQEGGLHRGTGNTVGRFTGVHTHTGIPIQDSGSAARFFYSAKADARDRWGSRHPTVKPVELIRWLVKLVTPPGGLVLDPFAGSGTTGAAALAEGRNAILIEREDKYVEDIRKRIEPMLVGRVRPTPV